MAEQVESVVVDEGRMLESPGSLPGGGEDGLAWQEFTVHVKLYGKVVRISSDARCWNGRKYSYSLRRREK
jgi:hypothetical protein